MKYNEKDYVVTLDGKELTDCTDDFIHVPYTPEEEVVLREKLQSVVDSIISEPIDIIMSAPIRHINIEGSFTSEEK